MLPQNTSSPIDIQSEQLGQSSPTISTMSHQSSYQSLFCISLHLSLLHNARCAQLHLTCDCNGNSEAEAPSRGYSRKSVLCSTHTPIPLPLNSVGAGFKEKRSKPKGTHATGSIRQKLFHWNSTAKEN